jgi:hypothetical protein
LIETGFVVLRCPGFCVDAADPSGLRCCILPGYSAPNPRTRNSRLSLAGNSRHPRHRHKLLQNHRDRAQQGPVQEHKEDPGMKNSARTVLTLAVLTALGGCIAVPVEPAYYEPAPVIYVPAPAWHGPVIRFDVYGGGDRHHHSHHHRGHGGRRGHR